MEFSTRVKDIIESHDFSYNTIYEQNGNFYVELQQYTPEGEDWYTTIYFDGTESNFAAQVMNYAENFDIDEEADLWVNSLGQNGVPDSISALLEDQKWKKDRLYDLARALS